VDSSSQFMKSKYFETLSISHVFDVEFDIEFDIKSVQKMQNKIIGEIILHSNCIMFTHHIIPLPPICLIWVEIVSFSICQTVLGLASWKCKYNHNLLKILKILQLCDKYKYPVQFLTCRSNCNSPHPRYLTNNHSTNRYR
jgi:hypothetical protein